MKKATPWGGARPVPSAPSLRAIQEQEKQISESTVKEQQPAMQPVPPLSAAKISGGWTGQQSKPQVNSFRDILQEAETQAALQSTVKPLHPQQATARPPRPAVAVVPASTLPFARPPMPWGGIANRGPALNLHSVLGGAPGPKDVEHSGPPMDEGEGRWQPAAHQSRPIAKNTVPVPLSRLCARIYHSATNQRPGE